MRIIKYGWGEYALWFVPVLFISSIFTHIFYSTTRNRNKLFIYFLAFVMSIVGSTLSYLKIQLPWSICSVPYAIFLIVVGTELRSCQGIIESRMNLIIIGVGFFITLLISLNWNLNIALNRINPLFPITIAAIGGTLMIYSISYWIERKSRWLSNILQAIGKETYIVVAFSQIGVQTLNTFFKINPILKYIILAISIAGLCLVKNKIVQFYRSIVK